MLKLGVASFLNQQNIMCVHVRTRPRNKNMCLVTKARMSMSGNFALELFSGIGGMSLGLHSAGFKTHGFGASERAVAMANENGSAATAVDVFDPDIVSKMRSVHPSPVLIHASPP